MEIRAIANNVILRKLPREIQTSSGILLGKDYDYSRDVEHGEVVSVGKGSTDDKGKFHPITDISPGMKVGYINRTVNKNMKAYNPNEIIDGDDVYVVVGSRDILLTE